MSGARLFVAVDPPREVRAALAAWTPRTVPGLRPVGADALHVTIAFLGTQPAELIDEIAATVVGAAGPVGELGLGAPIWLPPRRPRALAIELRDEGGLADLAADVGRALRLGAQRRFRPHITVARVRAGAVAAGALHPTPQLRFVPESLTLYRSRLSPDGASYQPLARVELFLPGSGPRFADG